MNRIMTSQVKAQIGKTVIVKGWVSRIKKLKSVTFIILRDRHGYLQCTQAPQDWLEIKLETVVSITGQVVASTNKYGNCEVAIEQLTTLSAVEDDLPFSLNGDIAKIGLDTLLNHRTLALRHTRNQAVFTIQNTIVQTFRKFLSGEAFFEIRTPKIVKEGAEGGSNVFVLDYFGKPAYLAQSPQFYKQMMVIAGMERVFEVAPVYRAEPHSSARHLNEYISMDVEMGFVDDIEALMHLETKLLNAIFEQIKRHNTKQTQTLGITLSAVPVDIPRLSFDQTIQILNQQYNITVQGADLNPQAESKIGQHIKATTGSDFVFITDYYAKKRPMYTMPKGTEHTHSFDLLYKGQEITTGGLRIHQSQLLIKNMKRFGYDPQSFASYLQAFKIGVPPHGGFAIGLERLTAKMLGIDNIRHCTMFPRDTERLTP